MECAGRYPVGKRWIDNMEECLRERGWRVWQAFENGGGCKGECMGHR